MTACSTTVTRYDADWEVCADARLADPLTVTARQALDRARTDGDPWLAQLVEAAQEGDELAGRCVVQAVLGRLAALTRRDPRLDLDAVVGALWLRILSYPLDRRPRAITSNLVLDARKDALAELRPLAALRPVEPRPQVGGLLADAVRTGVIDGPTGEVMRSVYVLGLSGEDAARLHGVAPTTVRWRCSDGRRRLARAR